MKLEYKDEEVKVCLDWIKSEAKPRKTFNRNIGSYGLKHVVERWSRKDGEYGRYIHEHSLIKAMEIAGFNASRFNPNGLSCNFNVSFKHS